MNKNIISKIEKGYSLVIKEITLLRESSDNKVFVMVTKDDQKYIIRISKRDILNDIIFEFSFMDFLAKKGLSVPGIIKTKSGNLFYSVGGSAVVVFEFIEGYHIKVTPDKKPDLKLVNQVAQKLAEIHNASKDFSSGVKRKRNIFTEIDRALGIKNVLAKKNEGGLVFVKEIQVYRRWANNHSTEEIIIHNDYRPGNILFKDKDLVSVVDFDWACKGPAIKDIALALVEWSFPDGSSEHWDDVFLSFLDGYNTVARKKVTLDSDLYKWICFSCLSDTATYLVDRANEGIYKKVGGSYMYKKYLYFRKFDNETLFL